MTNCGWDVDSIFTELVPRRQKYLYGAMHLLAGYGSYDIDPGPVVRRLRAFSLDRQLTKADGAPILHFTTYNLPLLRPPKGHHYLYIDTAWSCAFRDRTNSRRYNRRYRKVLNSLEKSAFRQMTHIFTTAEYVRNELIEFYGVAPESITCTGAGLPSDTEAYYGEKSEPMSVLYVAKHKTADKGGFLLLKAFEIAVRRMPSIHLTMVGPDELREASAGIPNVQILSNLSSADLRHLFMAASLFAMPALYEPWGLVYLQALATRAPILALRRNAVPEMTNQGEYAFLVDKPTPESVAAEMIRALSSPAERMKKADQGQKFCLKNFAWSIVAERITR
jgi:glycosyltransferase involved in cell wall biosynthesis